ncbi:MAG: hypothetical protein IIC70_02640 [Acidobacteria bacterium]|nr:hypothetical protein [Acidobacteriota bacterium]MCH8128780.1 hypothetical protein [Acidobacteriota bacterium]
MYPLRIVETDRDGFDQTVVELWREDEFVGMVFWDGSVPVVQIYPVGDDVHDLELNDLVRVLDTAQRIVDPLAFDEGFVDLSGTGDDWDDEDPSTTTLVTEFDPQAVHRSEDGEGFFPVTVAAAFIRKCEDLGLAVVEMEGFDLVRGRLKGRPGLELMARPQEAASFAEFRSQANDTAASTLAKWPSRQSMVIAFVIQQPDGETVVV